MIDLNAQHREVLIKHALAYMQALELFSTDDRVGATIDPHWVSLAESTVDTFAHHGTRDGNEQLQDSFNSWLKDSEVFCNLGHKSVTVTRRFKSSFTEIEIGLSTVISNQSLDIMRLQALSLENQIWALYQALPKHDLLQSSPQTAGDPAVGSKEWSKLETIIVRSNKSNSGQVVYFCGGKYKQGVACYSDGVAAEQFGQERLSKMVMGKSYRGEGWFICEKDAKGYNKVTGWKLEQK